MYRHFSLKPQNCHRIATIPNSDLWLDYALCCSLRLLDGRSHRNHRNLPIPATARRLYFLFFNFTVLANWCVGFLWFLWLLEKFFPVILFIRLYGIVQPQIIFGFVVISVAILWLEVFDDKHRRLPNVIYCLKPANPHSIKFFHIKTVSQRG